MKKILIFVLALGLASLPVNAQMRWNPSNNMVYTYPESPEINQCEYFVCILACYGIYNNMKQLNYNVAAQTVIQQCIYFLNSKECAAAQRLAQDLKSNAVYFPDGSYCWHIF